MDFLDSKFWKVTVLILHRIEGSPFKVKSLLIAYYVPGFILTNY